MIKLSDKKQGESVMLGFDVRNLMEYNEKPTTVTFNIKLHDGVDPLPNSMLSGSPVINGRIVSHRVINGIIGNTYVIEATINTSLNNVYIVEAIFTIK